MVAVEEIKPDLVALSLAQATQPGRARRLLRCQSLHGWRHTPAGADDGRGEAGGRASNEKVKKLEGK